MATVAPEIAAMLSEKDKHFAFEVTAGSNRKLTFVCPVCKKEFEAKICSVTIAVCPCPYCRKVKKRVAIRNLLLELMIWLRNARRL